MASETTNYQLVKPDPEEFYDVRVPNGNMDKIDTALKALSEALGGIDLVTLSQAISNVDQRVTTHLADSAKHNWYGTSSTPATTAAKVVTIPDFSLVTGARLAINFANANTASYPTININGTGSKFIYQNGSLGARWAAGEVVEFVYDGSYWQANPTVQKASTSQPGISQLEDSITSTATDKAATANAVKKTNAALISHAEDSMPHQFVDNGKTYRWGFRTMNGEPQMIYEEVTV